MTKKRQLHYSISLTNTGRGSDNDGMKKSEMTVTMPLTSFNEYEAVKDRYTELVKNLSALFTGSESFVSFDATKALSLCRKFIPYQFEKADIEIKC